ENINQVIRNWLTNIIPIPLKFIFFLSFDKRNAKPNTTMIAKNPRSILMQFILPFSNSFHIIYLFLPNVNKLSDVMQHLFVIFYFNVLTFMIPCYLSN